MYRLERAENQLFRTYRTCIEMMPGFQARNLIMAVSGARENGLFGSW